MEDVTFPELLDHLRNGGSALNLVGLVNLFVGQTDQDWTTKILSTLPIQTSSSLTAKNIKVVTQRLVHIEDIKDITSISFQVGTTNPDPLLEWKFALETYSPKPPYNVALSDLTVTIEQPVSFSRTLRGTYSGLFSGHDIIGEFTPDFFQGTTVFKTTFRGSYSIVELLATFFEDKFQYSEQLSKIRVPGLEELEHSVAPSHTSSFVVETIQSKSYLMQVSSGFPCRLDFRDRKHVLNWPFSLKLAMSLRSLSC
ncbi:hypothetical protein BYT27DRAFT_6741954 [Phlegmacium glaucopus]|nr:hypothetical protein BYT27DRAFT_6741954 [Phlegmacium glaucopus]